MAALTQFADSPRNGAWGDRPYTLVEVAGPASYTQVINGVAPAAPTGGQALTGISLQLGPGTTPEGILPVAGSTSGTYVVDAFQAGSYAQGAGNQTWLLRWSVAATGAEVAAAVNLSGEVVRLLCFGLAT
jgi:hypothetical protein